jgi:hypothetical protein
MSLPLLSAWGMVQAHLPGGKTSKPSRIEFYLVAAKGQSWHLHHRARGLTPCHLSSLAAAKRLGSKPGQLEQHANKVDAY